MNKNTFQHCRYNRLRLLSNHLCLKESHVDFIERLHFCVLKICALAVEDMARTSHKKNQKIKLPRQHMISYFEKVSFYLLNIKHQIIELDQPDGLTDSFQMCKSETGAIQYFSENLENKFFYDQYDIKISFQRKSLRFLYKNDIENTHEVAEEYYKSYRGKLYTRNRFTSLNYTPLRTTSPRRRFTQTAHGIGVTLYACASRASV